MPVIDIDRRSVTGLSEATAPAVFYDRRLVGFGLRVSASGSRSYFVEYRPGAGGRKTAKRRMVIGRDSNAFRADAARAMAETILARVALGEDPAGGRETARRALTVTEVFQLYLDERITPLRKARTLKLLEGYLALHIVPQLGTRVAASLTTSEVAKAHRAIGAGHRVTANRVVSALGAAIEFGRRSGAVAIEGSNPCSGVMRFREERRERLLSAEEYQRLGEALSLAEGAGLPWKPAEGRQSKHHPRPGHTLKIDPLAIAAIRLLLLTGARLREILNLRWDEVDLERGLLRLKDSKTGAKVVYLSAPAISILAEITEIGPVVFPGRDLDRPRADLNRPWAQILDYAKIDGLRLHDLRHGFASVGAAANLGLPVIGALLGHRSPSTTNRYAHLAADPLREANQLIGSAIALGLRGTEQ